MNSWPSPEMIAVRTGPSGPASSAMPDELQRRQRGGGAAALRRAPARGAATARARRARPRRGTRTDCGRAARGAASARSRSCSRAISIASSAPRMSIGAALRRSAAARSRDSDVAAPASHASERRADDHDRRRPLEVHRVTPPIVARALRGCAIIRRAPCIDWFKSRFGSSARRRRRHPRPIRLDAVPRQSRSPTSTAVR